MKGGDHDERSRLGLNDAGGMTQNLMPWGAGLPPVLRRPGAVTVAPLAAAPRVILDDSRRKRSVPYVMPPDIPIGRHRRPGMLVRLRAWITS